MSFYYLLSALINTRIKGIEILFVHLIRSYSESLTEALIVYYLSCPEELNDITHIGIVHETQDVIVGGSRLLLCRHILVKVSYYVALGLDVCRREGHARRRGRVNARGMVHEIGIEAIFLYILGAEISRKLINDGADHLEMAQLLHTDVCEKSLQLTPRHSEALTQITQRGAQLTVRACGRKKDRAKLTEISTR